jgi:hypothetical protein
MSQIIRVLRSIYYWSVIVLSLLSLGTLTFLSSKGWVLGAAAFILLIPALILERRNPTSRHPAGYDRLKKVAPALFLSLFLAYLLLCGRFGSPALDERPVLAERDQYRFTRGSEVSRVRYVTASICFLLGWHGGVIYVAIYFLVGKRHGKMGAISLDRLVFESDAVVVGTLESPALDEDLLDDVYIYRALIQVAEVISGELNPGQALTLKWVQHKRSKALNRHYERVEGKPMLWLLVDSKDGYYLAKNSGQCRSPSDRSKVEAFFGAKWRLS